MMLRAALACAALLSCAVPCRGQNFGVVQCDEELFAGAPDFCACGITDGIPASACCPASCGTCDGLDGCELQPGGSSRCRVNILKEVNRPCENRGDVACVIYEAAGGGSWSVGALANMPREQPTLFAVLCAAFIFGSVKGVSAYMRASRRRAMRHPAPVAAPRAAASTSSRAPGPGFRLSYTSGKQGRQNYKEVCQEALEMLSCAC